MQAANYLDIMLLLDIWCTRLGNMIQGKTADEIMRTFNLQNLHVLMQENAWFQE